MKKIANTFVAFGLLALSGAALAQGNETPVLDKQ
jgi:hypothetical protein